MNENSLKEIVRKYYLDYLNREPDSAGLEHYVYLMKTKQIDEKILQALSTKKKLADQITGDNWKELFI